VFQLPLARFTSDVFYFRTPAQTFLLLILLASWAYSRLFYGNALY